MVRYKVGQSYHTDRTAQTVGRVISRSHVVSPTFRQLREIYIGCARQKVSIQIHPISRCQSLRLCDRRAQHNFMSFDRYYTIFKTKSQVSKETIY